jgi:two-component system phosphate regulon sensor histidine kinase PhoR
VIARRPRSLYRIAAAATLVSAPSLIVFVVLAGLGLLPAGAALISGAVIWLATALFIGRFVTDLAVIRDAIDGADADEGARLARGLAPMVRELWLAITRFRRVWHERVRVADGRLAAAEAVIAAVPDPLILLDERRRIVHANAQAAAFIGLTAAPRDLAAALRNPAVLAAADAVLRWSASCARALPVSTTHHPMVRSRY